MYKFIQRNKKKMMAVFAAGLMVVFVFSTSGILGGQGGGRGGEGAIAYGHIGDRVVTLNEVAAARRQWETLETMGFGQYLGPALAGQMKEHPDFYFLLQEQARIEGIAVPAEQVEAILANEPMPGTKAQMDEFRRALHGFLLVQGYISRLSSNVKMSEPIVRRTMANLQDISLNIVELKADDFKPAGPFTDDELKALFDQTVTPAASQPATRPALSFDYEYPDRVKIQYLSFGSDQLRPIVQKQMAEDRWEVEARKYYRRHLSDYQAEEKPPVVPALQGPAGPPAPASQPAATAPASAPAAPDAKPAATEPAPAPKPEAVDPAKEPKSAADEPEAILAADVIKAATKPAGPTTRPFDEVKEQVLAQVMAPAIQTLSLELTEKIAARLAADATGQGAEFPTFAYLEKLAADIEKENGVRPTVVSKSNEWTAVWDLAKIPGLGEAANGQQRLSEIARQVEGLATDKAVAPALKLNAFAAPLKDPAGTVYFVRFTEVQKAHQPAAFAEVRTQLETDLRTLRGYEKAKEQAQVLLTAANQQGLHTAAQAAKHPVITTGTFGTELMGRDSFRLPIPGYETDFVTKSTVVRQAFQLLSAANIANPYPRAVLDVANDRKVLVVELASTVSKITGDMTYRASVQLAYNLTGEATQALAAEMLDYKQVKERLGFRPEHGDKEE